MKLEAAVAAVSKELSNERSRRTDVVVEGRLENRGADLNPAERRDRKSRDEGGESGTE